MVEGEIYAHRFSSQFARRQIAAALDYLSRLTRRASERGILIGAATDAPFYGYMTAGEALVEEVLRLHDAGLTPYDAIAAATSGAARYARKEQELGTIEVGKSADLLLLASDPLQDPSALKQLSGVMMRGQWCDTSCLARLRAAAATDYRRTSSCHDCGVSQSLGSNVVGQCYERESAALLAGPSEYRTITPQWIENEPI